MVRGRAARLARLAAALAALLVLGCGAAPPGGPSQGGSSPSPGGPALADLKYRLIAQVGPVFYCDPDVYPVARVVPDSEVHDRLEAMRSEAPDTYRAILSHLGLDGGALSPAQERSVYQDFKTLAALRLSPDGDGYDFDYTVGPRGGSGRATEVKGRIDRAGQARVLSRAPRSTGCPICLAAGTRIASPTGEVPVELLRPGAIVWTRDGSGARVAAPVVAVGRAPVPPGHQVVRLALADGRSVEVSPGHPTADGRRAGDLGRGDRLDGSVVVAADRVRYSGVATYDILPAGPTGFYWAGGVLLASTLGGRPAVI